jgi:hypothetical protein
MDVKLHKMTFWKAFAAFKAKRLGVISTLCGAAGHKKGKPFSLPAYYIGCFPAQFILS